jgi:hypothetical protein
MLKNQNYNINKNNLNNYDRNNYDRNNYDRNNYDRNNYNKNYNYYKKNDTNYNNDNNDNNKTNNYNDVINDLQDYMFYNKKLVSSLKLKINNNITVNNNNFINNKIINNKKFELNKTKIKTKSDINTSISTSLNLNINQNIVKKQYTFYPQEKDNLFWCFYIFKHGLEKYQSLEDKNIVVEKKIKIEYVELLRKQKKVIKNYKIAPLSYIENFLANEEKIDLKTFLALCIIENINVMYIHKKTFFENIISEKDDEDNIENENNENNENNNDIKINIIVKSEEYTNKYGCEINVLNEKIKDYRNKYYKLENIDKPVKAFSSYKLDDLIKLSEKLAIDILNPLTNKKKSKKELYESIIQYF